MMLNFPISVIVIAFSLTVFSCKNNDSNDQSNSEDTVVDTSGMTVQEKIWEEFTGILPCADCSGIETTLRLSPDGSRFQLQSIYLGKKDNEYIESGDVMIRSGYQLNDNAVLYSLVPNDEKEESRYFLRKSKMSDTLHMMDQNMKLIESDLNYTLIKTNQ